MSSDDSEGDPEQTGRREDGTIVVPMRMYKGITVFSTLVATVLVVFGFFLFDAATHAANPIRRGVVWVISLSGWTPAPGAMDVVFGLLGVAVILLGAGSYVLGTRFKTADMVEGGKDDEDGVGESDG